MNIRINDLCKLALDYYKAGDLSQAANLCMEIIKVQPNRIFPLTLLEEITFQLGDHDLSNDFQKKAQKISKDIGRREHIAYTYLIGKGIEFGAFHAPLPVNLEKASIVYADRLTKLQALERFPELKQYEAFFIEPEFIIDFDKDDISFLVDYDFDFFIANHFIEHIANPIRFLKSLSSVMKSVSILFLAVPNKEFTFDKKRENTTNEHLWQDYINNEITISDEHIEDFLLNKEKEDFEHNIVIPTAEAARNELFDHHRERSIHVHVWNRFSFDNFLDWINNKLELQFEVMNTHDPNEFQYEMIYLLRKN